MRFAATICFCLAAAPALGLDVPGPAQLQSERTAERDRYAAPTGPFADGSIPTVSVDGPVRRQAWRISGASLTVLQIAEALSAQLEEDGFNKVFDCVTDACGGFDFRFGTEIQPAPSMYVNLREFQFLTFVSGTVDAPTAVTTVLVSKARDTAYVQIIETSQDASFEAPKPSRVTETREPSFTPPLNELQQLISRGSVVLDGLEFDTGATTLGEGPFPVLQELSAFLGDNPELKIALVGHTDSVGSRDGNIRVSRARAQSVLNRLVETYGVQASRLSAEGMGYLAPRASNLTATGRDANRRVEAIVLSAE